MGDGMAVAMIKGKVLHRLDRALNRRGARARLLESLRECRATGQTVVDLFRKEGALKSDELLDHLDADVFGRPGPGWWPGHSGKDAIVREGLITALERATVCRRIDSYWVCSADLFQVAVTRSAREVNLVFLTPPPPHPETRPAPSVEEAIWVVMDEASAREVERLNEIPVLDRSGDPRDPRTREKDRIVQGPEGSGVWIVQPLRS